MKKGEMRKNSILKAAEQLFFEKGYEQTSVQDILDALSISKGGFYHYFESKIALLEEIARQHSENTLERIRMELMTGKFSPIQKVNLLLGSVNLFARETPEFIALVLKISYIDGDVNFREHTRSYLLDSLRPLLDEVIREGLACGDLFTRHPAQLGRMLLMLTADVNDAACRLLTLQSESPECVIEIIDLLNTYRDSVEMLSGAPFGRIELFDLDQMMSAFRETAKQINLLKVR